MIIIENPPIHCDFMPIFGTTNSAFYDICLMNLVLMGYMGSGKSAVGRQIAVLLQRPFIDLDLLIEQRMGLSITEIFEQKGAVFFRKREAEILSEVINTHSDAVIALGGGTPIYGNNLNVINDTTKNYSVYLKIAIEPLIKRLWIERQNRPLIADIKTPEALEEFVRKHLFERTYTYQKAHKVFEVDALDIDKVAEGIIAAFRDHLTS